MHRSQRERLPRVRMALAAGSGQIGFGNGGTRVARGQDFVHPVATGAIGNRLRPGLSRQAVVAVLVTGDAVGRKVEPPVELRVAVTARAGGGGHVGHEDGRGGIPRGQNVVLAMAVGAGGRRPHPSRHRAAVDALLILSERLAVTVAAGCTHVSFGDRRAGIGGRQDIVRAVTIVASRSLLSLGDGPRVYARLVGLHRPCRGKQVLSRQLGVGVAAGAGRGQVLGVDRRVRG